METHRERSEREHGASMPSPCGIWACYSVGTSLYFKSWLADSNICITCWSASICTIYDSNKYDHLRGCIKEHFNPNGR